MRALEAAADWRKGIAAVLAFVGVLASSGLLDGSTQAWVTTIVSAIGAALVVLVPNGHGEDDDGVAAG